MIRALVAAVVASMLGSAGAGAQQIQSPYRFVEKKQSVSAFAGVHFSDTGALDLGPEGGTAFGARYTIQVGGAFAVEADLSLLPTSRNVFTTDTIPAPDGGEEVAPERIFVAETDMLLLNAQAGLRFNLTGPRTYRGLQPYLLFGGGVVVDLEGTADVEEDIPTTAVFDFGTSFAGQFGAGIEWFAQDRLAARLDIRDILWKIETPQAFLGPRIPADEWVQSPVVSLGVSVYF